MGHTSKGKKMVKIVRKNLLSGTEKSVAGYDSIPVSLAIEFLDRVAKEFIAERETVRDTTTRRDGLTRYERTINDGDVDTFAYYLVFANE